MNKETETKLYTKQVIATVISTSFIFSIFASFLLSYNYNEHLNKEIQIYQFDFMPTDYKEEKGYFVL